MNSTITIRLEDIIEASQAILSAVDSSIATTLTDTLEVKAENKKLYLAVTNGEYYVKINIDLSEDINFHAAVNATTFLKLISAMTAETITLSVDGNFLNVKGNGNYKLPLIYENSAMLNVPEITIDNVTNTFDISSDILTSILNVNSKELTRGVSTNPVQRCYYIDNNGCITFTSGATVNKFGLPCDIKILLTSKIVNLFKLFKNTDCKFTIGYDDIGNNVTQTKISLETAMTRMVAVLSSDNALINTVPAEAIRDRAYKIYPHSVVFNKQDILSLIARLQLFKTESSSFYKCVAKFTLMMHFVQLMI